MRSQVHYPDSRRYTHSLVPRMKLQLLHTWERQRIVVPVHRTVPGLSVHSESQGTNRKYKRQLCFHTKQGGFNLWVNNHTIQSIKHTHTGYRSALVVIYRSIVWSNGPQLGMKEKESLKMEEGRFLNVWTQAGHFVKWSVQNDAYVECRYCSLLSLACV